MTAVISKRQAKFARYLANCAFGKSGKYCKRDGRKERTYIASGCALIWTEVTVPGGLEVDVLKAVWNDKKYPEGMLVFSPEHMDFEAAMAILACENSCCHENIVQLAPAVPEANPQPAGASTEASKDMMTAKTPEPRTLSAREKLTRCATMRLAKENGVEIDADFDATEVFSKIVSTAGDKAVRRYQELLSSVPAYGLTEARIRLAFPHEFETLF